MNEFFKKTLSNMKNGLCVIEEIIIVSSITIIFILITSEVIARFVFKSGIMWELELTGFLFVLMGMVGGATAVRKNMHVRLNYLIEKAPKPLAIIIKIINSLVILCVLFVLLVGGIQFANDALTQTSIMLDIPMFIIYSFIPLGSFLMIIWFIYGLFYSAKVNKNYKD
ncbi:MAG: TRAP transporter small permease [Candidatus Atribacteria bacterium]|nr:TRAP transporter small permease [Candidatus Atribacteria bacterium]